MHGKIFWQLHLQQRMAKRMLLQSILLLVMFWNHISRGDCVNIHLIPFKIGTSISSSEPLKISATQIYATINRGAPSYEILRSCCRRPLFDTTLTGREGSLPLYTLSPSRWAQLEAILNCSWSVLWTNIHQSTVRLRPLKDRVRADVGLLQGQYKPGELLLCVLDPLPGEHIEKWFEIFCGQSFEGSMLTRTTTDRLITNK